MKYVVTGSLGNISKPIATALVKAGHDVTVVASKLDRVKEIESLGAKAAVGSVDDAAFISGTFKGADAVYTMVPPIFISEGWKAYIAKVGKIYADAIKKNGIKHVVNLSSVGADLPDGCGPVSGLHHVEIALDAVPGINVKHLRPGYFFQNLLANVGMVKHMGIIGGNFGVSDKKFVAVDPSDIAEVAVQELLALKFTGSSVVYIASDEFSTDDIAATLGKAIGKPDLKWLVFTDEQATQGAVQAGLPEEMAVNYTEMGHSLNTGAMLADYWKHHPASLGKVKLADFAKTFAAVYNSPEPAAAH